MSCSYFDAVEVWLVGETLGLRRREVYDVSILSYLFPSRLSSAKQFFSYEDFMRNRTY